MFRVVSYLIMFFINGMFVFLKFVINYVSYFDIFKYCSVNNHLIFIRQYCLVFFIFVVIVSSLFSFRPEALLLAYSFSGPK